MLKIFLLSLLVSTGMPSVHTKNLSFVIEGVVTNEEKQPLQKVFLYTVLGVEETITNNKGEFRLKTDQAFPVKLVVQSKDYEDKQIELTADAGKLSIVLKRK